MTSRRTLACTAYVFEGSAPRSWRKQILEALAPLPTGSIVHLRQIVEEHGAKTMTFTDCDPLGTVTIYVTLGWWRRLFSRRYLHQMEEALNRQGCAGIIYEVHLQRKRT